MYVTRPLSQYLRSPELLSIPPEGPNSGYLVIQDEESETTCCFGSCKNWYLMDLPFPQNKNLTVKFTSCAGQYVSCYDVNFIPVLNQPLSSNRYYAIKPHGAHKGEACACACAKEEDMTNCCFFNCIKNVNPRPLDPNDIYQQFEIVPACETPCSCGGMFFAKSVAPDGFPPHYLRRRGWEIYTKSPKTYELGEALGVNTALRAQLPDFDSPLVVGKWYCPFMFVKDGNLRDQTKRSMYYEMTLERRWEMVFSCENSFSSQTNSVSVDTEVQREVVVVGEREEVWDANRMSDGVVWFSSAMEEGRIGLSSLIVDRMKWEEERGGWLSGEKRKVKVNRTEEFVGMGGRWSKFGCYVLVERFVLKRMDGSLVLTYDFKHTHVIRSKWE